MEENERPPAQQRAGERLWLLPAAGMGLAALPVAAVVALARAVTR